MALASRPLIDKASLSHQILTSVDLVVMTWETRGDALNHLQGPLELAYKRSAFWVFRCVAYVFSL